MATQTYSDDVIIDGSENEVQLTVQGHSTQTNSLQEWQDSAGNTLAKITEDGRFQNGDDLGLSTSDALIEAHRDNDATMPERGVHSLGRFSGIISTAIAWLVGELELVGSAAISSIHAAVRGRLTHSSTGDSSNAEMRAGDFEVVNQSGTSGTPVGVAIGVQATVDNQTNAHLTKASSVVAQIQNATGAEIETATALEVAPPVNTGTIDTLIGLDVPDMDEGSVDNFAIRTGLGAIRLGDIVELVQQLTDPVGKTGLVQLYAKDNKLYAVAPDDTVYDLTQSGGGGGATNLGGLTDVDTTGQSSGNILSFNGTNWVPVAGGSGGYHTHYLSEVLDAGSIASQDKASVDIDGGNVDNVYLTAIAATLNALTTENETWYAQENYLYSDSAHPKNEVRRARGTKALPAAVQAGDTLGGFILNGYDGSAYAYGGEVKSKAAANWSGSVHDASLELWVSRGSEIYGHPAALFEPNNTLQLFNSLATPSATSAVAKLWADGGELKVMDQSGNITTLSSHNPQLVDPTGRPTSYVHAEKNPYTGKYVEIDTYKMAELLEQLTGEQLIHVQELPAEDRMDWATNEARQVAEREIERQRWEALPEERRELVKPEAYSVRPEPQFLKNARNWRREQ